MANISSSRRHSRHLADGGTICRYGENSTDNRTKRRHAVRVTGPQIKCWHPRPSVENIDNFMNHLAICCKCRQCNPTHLTTRNRKKKGRIQAFAFGYKKIIIIINNSTCTSILLYNWEFYESCSSFTILYTVVGLLKLEQHWTRYV